MPGDFHQLMIGQFARFAKTTERLVPQIVPVQVDFPQVVPALRR